jgi:hypothetical protein
MLPSSNHTKAGVLVRYGAAFVTAMLVAMVGSSGCGGPSSNKCRFHPEACHGAAGALCESDHECGAGTYCCTENDCGGGMCTFDCDHDHDCPGDMLCDNNLCFYACDSDADCAPTMKCSHNDVCKYD